MRHIANYLNLLRDIASHSVINSNIVILEIGVGRGHSTKALLGGLKEREERNGYVGELYSMDIEDCYRHVARKKEFSETEKYWEFILGDSKELKWDKPIDILFIDGDHAYEGVKADFERYEPFVKKDGLILMHDVTFPRYGVKDLWKEIKYPKVILKLDSAGFGIVHKA